MKHSDIIKMQGEDWNDSFGLTPIKNVTEISTFSQQDLIWATLRILLFFALENYLIKTNDQL